MKVDMVSTWCISGFVFLAADLASSMCGMFNYLVSRQSFFHRPLPYHSTSSGVHPTATTSLSTAFLTWRTHTLIVSHPHINVLSATSQASFGSTSSYLHKHITIGRYPFIRRSTAHRTTHVLKHPGYWCYPGVESRSFVGRGQADA